jgi:hypothetical protein
MGKRREFTVTATTTAEPRSVFALLKDGASWPTWSPIGSFRLERRDPSGGEGVGAIRVFSTGPVRSREEIVEVSEAQRFSYVAHSGLPLRQHRADVDVQAEAGTTRITWREGFEPRWPGTGAPLAAFLRSFVQRCVDGLAAEAGRLAAATGH